MLARLGFVASVLSEDVSSSATCRLHNVTPERLRELTKTNLVALDRIVAFLERHRIRLYRLSSNIIPFASHPINELAWWAEFAPELRRLGRRIRAAGVRVSTHPGQFTVLNSPNESIVQAAVAELIYHAKLLDALGTDASSKIVVHVGGLYGGSTSAAMERFVKRSASLPPDVRRRLVVENDDRLFDADEALEVGRRAGIPVVFDWLHHQANPCRRSVTEVLAEIFGTWTRSDGRPKIHFSTQAEGRSRGAHADYVMPDDLLAFLNAVPAEPFDCMLEAKQKDRALLKLRDELRARGVVESDAGSAAIG